jgi:hypothetical protein
VDREDLAISQVETEAKADQRENVAGQERRVAGPAQRGQDQDVRDQAEERYG